MAPVQRVVKPKNARAKRALENRAPKAIENCKEALLIRGAKCSETVLQLLKELSALKRPYAQNYGKKNDIRPFEDVTPVEKHCQKHDASLFAFANHNKKRPDNLILGRMYDHHLLDMVELGVSSFQSMSSFPNEKLSTGTKPCLLFSGQQFEQNDDLKRLKSLLIDFFRGAQATNVRLAGLEHALQFTALDEKTVLMRSYRIVLKKSADPKTPRVELDEIGPSVDLTLRRTHLASEDLFKTACKQQKNLNKPKKVKNIEEDALGTTLGKIHIPSQDIKSVQTRKMKGLKVDKKAKKEEEKKKKEQEKKKKKEDEEEEEMEEGDEEEYETMSEDDDDDEEEDEDDE